MANVKGARLTLPDGTVFFGDGNIQVQIEQTREWLIASGSQIIGFAGNLFDEVGGSGSAVLKTPLADGYLGAAGGSHIYEIDFQQWVGSADSWGPANADDSVLEKAQVLDMELARVGVDSLNPATLEVGAHSTGTSRYDALPVVPTQVSITVDTGESNTVFSSSVTFAETIDLSQTIDGGSSVTAEYELSSSGTTASAIPIAADTLGTRGQGSGAETQGMDTAPSNLVDQNGGSANPTTQRSSLKPGRNTLRGAFRGANAASLADSLLNDYIGNDSVTQVTISATAQGSTPTPITGTFRLGENCSVDPVVPQVDGGVYAYTLDLRRV